MTETRSDSRLAQWGALAGGLAHEIKNPLSTINISLQLVREDLEGRATIPSAQLLPRIDLILNEVLRLQKILNDFLRLARAPELASRERDPNALFEEVLAFVAPELRKHGINVVTQLDRTVRAVRMDSDLIRQALLNLLRNAIDAMPRGGTLTLCSTRDGDRLRVEVIDTGEGIAEQILSRIFDGFFSTKPGGTGIGLALTRQIVERHGGTVSCESAPGFGSKFTILLPVGGPANPEER